ncbi:MAG: ADP-ribosylglycohydrolase family protein, partial [Myxococcota bacterium]
PDSVTRDRLNQLSGSADRTIEEVASVFGASGYVAESVPLALFAVTCVDPEATRRPPSPSRRTFAGALESLIRVGGDTDTNASIFGQVCGAIFGLDGLPTQTVELDIDGEIGRIARDLTEAIKRSKRSLF